MMVKTRILPILIGLFFLLPCWPDTPCAQAATARKAPVAQQPPVPKSPPQPRAVVTPLQKAGILPKKAATTQKPAATQKAAATKQKPAAATQKPAATAQKPAATQKAAATAKNTASAPQSGPANDPVKTALDAFAQKCISSMNKHRKPGISSKEVTRQPDGTYMARYLAVDMDSLVTSYNPTTNNKTIKYIGRMVYHEVEYVSTGKNQKQAMAGPFSETNRTPITELIKYKSGKWTY